MITAQLIWAGSSVVFVTMLLHWISGAFLLKYLRVRASMGKLILVKVRDAIDDYWAIGSVKEGIITYKPRGSRGKKNINMTPLGSYRIMMVACVDVDADTNAIMKRDYTAVTGFDAEKHNSLLERALMGPPVEDMKQKIIFIAVLGCLLGVAITLFFVYNMSDKIEIILTTVQGLRPGVIQ